MCRRLLSLIIAIIMVLAMMPVTVFAEELVSPVEEQIAIDKAAPIAEEVAPFVEAAPVEEAVVVEEAPITEEVVWETVDMLVGVEAVSDGVEELPAEEVAPVVEAAVADVTEAVGEDIAPVADVEPIVEEVPEFTEGYIHVAAGTVVYDGSKVNALGTLTADTIVLAFADPGTDWLYAVFAQNGAAYEGWIHVVAIALTADEVQVFSAVMAQYAASTAYRGYTVPVVDGYAAVEAVAAALVSEVAAPVSEATAPAQNPALVVENDANKPEDEVNMLIVTVELNVAEAVELDGEDVIIEEAAIDVDEVAPVMEAVFEEIADPVEAEEVAVGSVPVEDIEMQVALAGDEIARNAYIKARYEQIAGTTASDAVVKEWSDKNLAAAPMLAAMFRTDAFKNRNLSSAETINVLFQAMFGREADESNKSFYGAFLDDYLTTDFLIDQLAKAPEFANVCAASSMEVGAVELTELRDMNFNVTRFVDRCYRLALNREPDINGLNGWCGQLFGGYMSAAEIVEQFIFSKELLDRNLSDSKTIDLLYQTMLGRTADAEGKEYWLKTLSVGASMRYVVDMFADSPEFKGICKDFGVWSGRIVTAWRDKNIGVTAFVYRCYVEALKREPDIFPGLEGWCGNIVRGEMSYKEIADQFIFSKEALDQNWSDEEFLNRLYHLYMGREPDADGFNGWLGQLKNGAMTRQQVSDAFAGSAEFANLTQHPEIIVTTYGKAPEDEYADFEFEVGEDGVTVTKYTGASAEVVVPDTYEGKPIIKIGDRAFEGNTTLTSIDLPDTVQVIGKRAFAGCSSLAEMK